MSIHLSENIIKEVNRRYMKNINCINCNFSDKTISDTLLIMKEISLAPDEIIFK